MTHDQDALTADEAVNLSAQIVAAYVAHNSLPAADLPKVLASVHAALTELGRPAEIAPEKPAVETPSPAAIRKSITQDGIVSFIDGRSYKTLKRHLGTHGFSPEAYRQRYGLPSDYPMVAPSYAAQRSALAKAIGLGVPGGRAPAADAAQAA